MPQSYLLKKRRGERGSALLVVSGISLAIGIGIMALQFLMPEMKRQSIRSSDIISYQLAMNSIVDYTAHLIKQRKCLDQQMVEKANCAVSDPGMTERLLLNEESADFLYNTNSSSFSGPGQVTLDKIEFALNPTLMTSRHPLYSVLRSLPENIEEVNVVAEKENSIYKPTTTDQIYLRIRASFDRDPESSFNLRNIFGTKDEIFQEAFFALYRRELGSMALVVADELVLNTNAPVAASAATQAQAGDAYISLIDSNNRSTSRGVVFKSPVFVNTHVVLPDSDDNPDYYSDVTFADKLILGNGRVLRNGNSFQPSGSVDGRLQTWTDLPFMGGFLGGIQVDGEIDPGLPYFIGNQAGAVSQTQLATQCIARNGVLTSLSNTKYGQLIFKPILQPMSNIGGRNSFEFKLALSQDNEFAPQTSGGITQSLQIAPGSSTSAWIDGSGPSWTQTPTSTAPVMEVEVKVGDLEFTALLPKNSGAEAKINVAEGLQDRFQDAREVRDDAEEAFNDAKDEVDDDPTDPDNIELAKKLDPGGELYLAREQARQVFNNARTQRDRFLDNTGNPLPNAPFPKLSLKLDEVLIQNGSGESISQPNQLSLKVDLENVDNFTNDPIQINLRAYELGDDGNGTSLRLNASGNRDPDKQVADRNYNAEIELSRSSSSDPFALSSHAYVPAEGWFVGDASSNRTIVWSSSYNPSGTPPVVNRGSVLDETFNYGELADLCNGLGGGNGNAFAVADWNSTFAEYSRHSWKFANPKPSNISTLSWRAGNNAIYNIQPPSAFGPNEEKFQVLSIVDGCKISANVDVVAGFFMCDTLEIAPRTDPLQIVGSFIVGHMSIPAQAVEAGVEWYSIYHPEGIQILRREGVLRDLNGNNCDIPDQPIWHPYPSLNDLSRTFKCSPLSLRGKADNWTWTQVNPEQAVINNSPTRRPMPQRFLLKEIFRESNI